MKRREFSRAARVGLSLLFMLMVLAQTTFGGEFYGIVDSFGKRARNAYMEVGVDTRASSGGPSDVEFTIFDSRNGVTISDFVLTTNAKGFVSTASFENLFNITGGQPLVVRARTPQASLAAATLYVDSLGAPLTLGVLQLRTISDTEPLGMGTRFSIAVGNVRLATLLIANVSGTDQGADVFIGTRGADGRGTFTNPRIPSNAVWRVNLTPNEAMSNLVVSATGNIVVQVVIDDGRSIQSFQVLPS